MSDVNPGQSGPNPERRSRKVYSGILWTLVIAAVLASCSTNKSGCGGCQGCTINLGWVKDLITLVLKALSPPGTQCERFCTIKVQFVDASTGTPLSGVAAGSFVDFDVTNGGTPIFSGSATVASNGTFSFPVNPCLDKNTNLNALQIVPFGFSLRANNGCPAGQCRTFAPDPTQGSTLQGVENPCTPVIRVPVRSNRPCGPC